MDYSQQLGVALKAAKKASKKILEYYYKGFNVKFKADKSEVTNADLASEKIIKETLTKAYPDYGMLSEESVDDKSRLTIAFLLSLAFIYSLPYINSDNITNIVPINKPVLVSFFLK